MLADYYQFLKKFLSFETISADIKCFDNMANVVNWLSSVCKDNGMGVKIFSSYGNPILFASYEVDSNLPTCLLYGYYDVQQVKSDLWDYDPFSLFIGKNSIVGRGVVANKGQLSIHLLTLFSLIKEKKLAYNIKIIIEGEKEIGSPHLSSFVQEQYQLLQSDFIFISDGSMLGLHPTIGVGYRGIINMKLTLQTAKNDLDSGIYGGIVPNPIHEMVKLLAGLYDRNQKITLPYFYYDIDDIDSHILSQHKEKLKYFLEENFLDHTGVSQIIKERDVDIFSQLGCRPTIQLTGIQSGHVDGYSNTIPSMAVAHLNFRLVKHQKIAKIENIMKQWLQVTLPKYLSWKLDVDSASSLPVCIEINNVYSKRLQDVLFGVYQKKVLYDYSGGELGVVHILGTLFQIPILSVPLANENCNIHSTNEFFKISYIEKGLLFSSRFFCV